MRSGFIISGILAFVFLFSSCGHETMEQEEAVAAITINQASVSLAAGETAQLSAVVQPSSATDQRIIWTSSNESVATVSQTGLVTAVGNGDAIITASAGEKSSTCHVTVYIQIQFDDAVFKAECLYHFDKDGDGELSTIEALEVTSILINPGKGISSLKGIEFFANLDTLICCGNQLTSLDVSNNPALTVLECFEDKLTSLDVSNNPALTVLQCDRNQLTNLDVSNNPALTVLNCWDNQLTSLDVSNNPALTKLNCGWNQLTSLDVSNNSALTRLDCQGNQLNSLDVSNNPALTGLNCWDNQLTSLDVSKNPALTVLECFEDKLTSLDVSNNPALTVLNCARNQLTSLDVSNNPALTGLHCYSNQLTSLNVSNNPELTELDCGDNQLTSLDVSKNPALTVLYCMDNQLTNLDVSNNPALTKLSCGWNQLTSLDVSNNPALTELYCLDSQLTSLDVSHNPALTKLNCGWNQLTSLDVSNNPALTELYCERNQLTNLDVSHNPALTNLLCSSNNNLKEIWLSNGQTIPDFSFDSSIASIKRGHRVPEAVDLGLSVKWASCNLGASSPEEYGDYYAWGETTKKSDYSWLTYKFRTSGDDYYNVMLSKYITNSSYGPIDYKTTLELSDDAAHVNWGGSWRMPTDAEWTELRENCIWTWTTQNGITGYKVTSKTNGNSIFLPSAGNRDGKNLNHVGLIGRYWSSSLFIMNMDYTVGAWGVYFNSAIVDRELCSRFFGQSVRPVYGDYVADVPVTSISLNKTNLTLTTGSTEALAATVSPTNATNKTVTWSSSNTAVATVSSSGVVTAKALGTATITASAGGKTASCTVSVTRPSNNTQEQAVDLGLSVKWASCNLGASSPEEYGDYYAWGETIPKNNYDWETYIWCKGLSKTLTKYNINSTYGTVDMKTTLELSDDAARAKWVGNWRMPTNAEWTELKEKCTWTWTTQNGKNGYKVTSKTNGNSIFLPAAGRRSGTTLNNGGYYGDFGEYWSSSLDDNTNRVWIVSFNSVFVERSSSSNLRCNGLSVRPVYGSSPIGVVAVTGVNLNKNNLTLEQGESQTLTAAFYPSNATDKTVTWSSNNTDVAYVSYSGVVTAKAVGTATITASVGGKTASCSVTVTQPSSGPKAVDLGLSVKWASCNLGASSPEAFGDYYAWGETEVKSDYSWSTYKWGTSGTSLTKYNTNSSNGTVDNKTVLDPEDDVAHVKFGGNWRMPTLKEWEELTTKCKWTWTDNYNGSGVKGRIVTASNGNSIFIPAAGYVHTSHPEQVGSYGMYWSSSLLSPQVWWYPDQIGRRAWQVIFNSGSVDSEDCPRANGCSVRPVLE